MKIRDKFVDDFDKAHKWLSMRIMAVTAALPIAWLEMPDDWKAVIPHWGVLSISLLSFASMTARVIKQKNLLPPDEAQTNDKSS